MSYLKQTFKILWRDDGQVAMPLAVRVTPSEFVSGDTIVSTIIQSNIIQGTAGFLLTACQQSFYLLMGIKKCANAYLVIQSGYYISYVFAAVHLIEPFSPL